MDGHGGRFTNTPVMIGSIRKGNVNIESSAMHTLQLFGGFLELLQSPRIQ